MGGRNLVVRCDEMIHPLILPQRIRWDQRGQVIGNLVV